jgi:hypothetical protein
MSPFGPIASSGVGPSLPLAFKLAQIFGKRTVMVRRSIAVTIPPDVRRDTLPHGHQPPVRIIPVSRTVRTGRAAVQDAAVGRTLSLERVRIKARGGSAEVVCCAVDLKLKRAAVLKYLLHAFAHTETRRSNSSVKRRPTPETQEHSSTREGRRCLNLQVIGSYIT